MSCFVKPYLLLINFFENTIGVLYFKIDVMDLPQIFNSAADADSLTEVSTNGSQTHAVDGSGSISLESEPTVLETEFGQEIRTKTPQKPPRADLESQNSTPVSRILASTGKKLTNIKRRFRNVFNGSDSGK